MQDIVVVILGGGQGARLYPLTKVRSKPAVPIAGKYRLIDIPVSNAINSDLKKIFVLTQFNSASLNDHVMRTYHFDPFSNGFVEVLAAEQTQAHGDWYQGTADAVRKQQHRFLSSQNKYVLILAGDQLYRMDYRDLVKQHEQRKSDITVAVVPVKREQASQFGILKIDTQGKIVDFCEKPKDPDTLDRFECPPEFIKKLGISDPSKTFLASMGIYLFHTKTLEKELSDPTRLDFGHHIIPSAISNLNVSSYIFDDYWEDIGTIRAFYDANIDLGDPMPNFHFYRPDAPIYTRPRYLPASKLYDCVVHNSVISEGCLIRDSVIHRSVVGIRTRINRSSRIRNSIIMGADSYETKEERERTLALGWPELGIGENVIVENAIVDKNARIGEGVIIRNEKGIVYQDSDNYFIREGIVIIPKDAIIQPGTLI